MLQNEIHTASGWLSFLYFFFFPSLPVFFYKLKSIVFIFFTRKINISHHHFQCCTALHPYATSGLMCYTCSFSCLCFSLVPMGFVACFPVVMPLKAAGFQYCCRLPNITALHMSSSVPVEPADSVVFICLGLPPPGSF